MINEKFKWLINSLIVFLLLNVQLLIVNSYHLNKLNFQTKPIENKEIWGMEKNGLISRIYIDKKDFKVNEPIIIHYEKKNISKKIIKLWNSGFWRNHLIIV